MGNRETVAPRVAGAKGDNCLFFPSRESLRIHKRVSSPSSLLARVRTKDPLPRSPPVPVEADRPKGQQDRQNKGGKTGFRKTASRTGPVRHHPPPRKHPVDSYITFSEIPEKQSYLTVTHHSVRVNMRPYAPARANGSPRSHRESSPRMYYASPRDQAARPAGLSYQIQDNIPASPCHESSDDDQLLNEFFDWDRYYQTQETLVHQTPYPSPPRSPPRRHDSLKNPGIPAVAGQFGNLDFYPSMASSYGYPRHSSGSQSPPELVTGGNSPSEHSSAVSIDRFEEARRYHAISLKDFQAQDDEWTYPQDDLTRVLPQEYPSHLHVEHHRHRASDSSAGVKRRHSGKGSEKRHRHLSDPNQTADVRKNGACLPCRVLKTRVSRAPPRRPLPSRPDRDAPGNTVTDFVVSRTSSVQRAAFVPRAESPSRIMRTWSATARPRPWHGQ